MIQNPCDEEIFSLMSDDEINGSVKSCDDVTLEGNVASDITMMM